MVAVSELVRPRDPATGREIQSPLYIIAFQGVKPNPRVQVIEPVLPKLSIRILNNSNRLMGE